MKNYKIGDQVKVIVDRPLGSFHPEHKELFYPLNYGYIKDVFAPDGEEQDVYILGVDVPVTEFSGTLIAKIHRLNDVEDKWVVAPDNKKFSKEDIEQQVYFQEQYFQTVIIMAE